MLSGKSKLAMEQPKTRNVAGFCLLHTYSDRQKGKNVRPMLYRDAGQVGWLHGFRPIKRGIFLRSVHDDTTALGATGDRKYFWSTGNTGWEESSEKRPDRNMLLTEAISQSETSHT